MDKVTLSREDLYDLVWAESLPSLSKKFAIPYDDLRKLCKRMDIPLPKACYWENLRTGKEVGIEHLPADYTGMEEITFPLEGDKNQVVELLQSPLLTLQKEIERDNKSMLKVPSKLIDPDKLVVSAQRSLIGEKSDKYCPYRGLFIVQAAN